MSKTNFTQLARLLDEELYERVIPFWLRHGVDLEHGGLLTCLDEAGRILSTNKYMWSQTRALWVFSTLAMRAPDPRFRTQADTVFAFCRDHGRNQRGEWLFQVTREGAVVDGPDSIYTDGFAMMGLGAYYRLTGSASAAAILRETCESVRARLAVPGSYQTRPYQIPVGIKTHGIDMLFSLAFWEAGQALEDPAIFEEGVRHGREILGHFVFEKNRAIREFLDLQNHPLAGAIGSCCVPGHAIESMWAQMRIFRALGETGQIGRCAEVVRWHIEKGWDQEFGGIFLSIDLSGQAPYWPFADYKPWWPAVEAMYALLLAYAETRERWCLDWYERVHNYAFSHYPVRPDGEWRNRLDRQGRPVDDVIALPVKDPFHLPRSLILSVDVLRTMAEGPETVELI
jgi:N-acylglucosamine 2-epimerase